MALSISDLCTASAVIRVSADQTDKVVREMVKSKTGLIDTAALLSDSVDSKDALADRIMAEF